MAITKEWTIEKICKIIKEKKLYNVKDIVGFVPFSRKTLYENYIDRDKGNTIKKTLEEQKISWKQKLRKDFDESKNPILKLALYKLMADSEELEKLTVTKQDTNIKGELKTTGILKIGYDTKDSSKS